MKKIISIGLIIVLFAMINNLIFAQTVPTLTYPSAVTNSQTPFPFYQNTPTTISCSSTGISPQEYLGGVSQLQLITTAFAAPTVSALSNPNSIISVTLNTGINGLAIGTYYIVADAANNQVKLISSAGTLITIWGNLNGTSGDGIAFNNPTGVAYYNGVIYVADCNNNKIKTMSIGSTTTTVSTYAGSGVGGFYNSTLTASTFNYPSGIAVNTDGSVYIADLMNSAIRKISNSQVTTLAGISTGAYTNTTTSTLIGIPGSASGVGTSSSFFLPKGSMSIVGNYLYLADWGNNLIRQINISTTNTGTSTIFAGGKQGYFDGSGTTVMFNHPAGITNDGTNLYVADEGNNVIRKIVIITNTTTGVVTAGQVSTLAGNGNPGSTNGSGTSSSFYGPKGISYDGSGHVIVADALNNALRMINIYGYSIYPALPTGINFNVDGSISGTLPPPPSSTPLPWNNIYTVTATNAVGSTTSTLYIKFQQNPPTGITISPASGTAGTRVEVTCQNLPLITVSGVLQLATPISVIIAGVPVATLTYPTSFLQTSSNTALASFFVTVGNGQAGSSPISVTTIWGTGTSAQPFVYGNAPQVLIASTTSTPNSMVTCGQAVTIYGNNLTGASKVTFDNSNPPSASSVIFPFSSPSSPTTLGNSSYPSITATMLNCNTCATLSGSGIGYINVTNNYGESSSGINLTYSPWTISSISPTSGHKGQQITILGSNFVGVTGVTIGGAAAEYFNVVNPNTIIATVANATVTGTVTVQNSTCGCSATSTATYTNLDGSNPNTFGLDLVPDLAGNLYFPEAKYTDNGANDWLQSMALSTKAITNLDEPVTGPVSGVGAYSNGYLYVVGSSAGQFVKIYPKTQAITPLSFTSNLVTETDDPATIQGICQGQSNGSFYAIVNFGENEIGSQISNLYSFTPSSGNSYVANKINNTYIQLLNVGTGNSLAYNSNSPNYLFSTAYIEYPNTGQNSPYGILAFNLTQGSTATPIQVATSLPSNTINGIATDGIYIYILSGFTIYSVPINSLNNNPTVIATIANFPSASTTNQTTGTLAFDGVNNLYFTDGNHVYSYSISTRSGQTIFSTNPTSTSTKEVVDGVSIKITPNPSSSNANLHIEGLQDGTTSKVVITSAAGQTMWSKESVTNGIISLPTNLAAGSYFVSVVNGTKTKTAQWIKAK